MFPKDETVHDMLDRPADSVLDFIRNHIESVDGSLPWLDLAEGVSTKATSRPDVASPEALAWATAAVLLFDRLGERCEEGRDRTASTKAAMSLRAYMLNAHGPQSGHPVLDPMILEAWFFRGLEWRYEQVAQKLQSESDLSSSEFVSLNRLKDRIRILKSVHFQDQFQRPDELSMWYQLVSE